MGAGVLFFDKAGHILLIKPSYKEYWGIPGGVVDQGESPRAAAIREVKEEINLNIESPRFIGVEYYPNLNNDKGESLQFMFYGGMLTPDEISQIRLHPTEISEYQFVDLKTALDLVSDRMAQRLPPSVAAISAKVPIYREALE